MDVNKYLCTYESGYKSRRNYDESNFNFLLKHKLDYLKNSFFIRSANLWNSLLHSQKRASQNRSAAGLLNPVVNKPISAWMRSLALYLSVLTGPQWPVNRSVRSCCDRAVAMLFSTGLLEAVVTELQQCCFQQACRK